MASAVQCREFDGADSRRLTVSLGSRQSPACAIRRAVGRTRHRLLFLTLTLPLLLLLPTVCAQVQLDTSQREALEAEIADYQQLLEARREEAAEIEAALGETSEALNRRVAERDRISDELAELRLERETLQAQMRDLESRLEATEEEITRILADLDALTVRIQALLINLNRQRSGRFARVLSQAESFHDLQVKNYYLALLNEQDADVIERLDDTREELRAAQERLSGQLAALESAEEELRSNQARLEASERELAAVIAELESTRAGQLAQRQSLIEAQNALEEALGDLDRQLEAEVARLRAERQRLEREAAEAYLAERERQRLLAEADELGRRIDNLTEPIVEAASGYVYPVAGHSVISRYGQDNNSYLGLRASAANAAVVAVQAGVVRIVSYVSANDGYMVSIAHSDRLSTVYTNLRPPLVQVGDRVEQGEVIGHLGGSTLVAADTLKLWVQITENGRTAFVDPASVLGF